MRTGKIALLPDNIREDVNRRLHDGERGKSILAWLNSLPKVKAVLAKDFDGRPITPSNLTEWKQGGYIDWQVRQDALTLVSNLNDKQALGDDTLADKLNTSLARWLSIQYAAAAQAFIAVESNPDVKWNRLRQLCSDVTRLRRGDFSAERISIQQKRLSVDEKSAEQRLEDKFWDWTKRPEIAEKLWPPHKYPGGISPESLEVLDSYLLEGFSPHAAKYALNAKTWGAFANKPPKGWQPPPAGASPDITSQTGSPSPGAPASVPAASEHSVAPETSPTNDAVPASSPANDSGAPTSSPSNDTDSPPGAPTSSPSNDTDSPPGAPASLPANSKNSLQSPTSEDPAPSPHPIPPGSGPSASAVRRRKRS